VWFLDRFGSGINAGSLVALVVQQLDDSPLSSGGGEYEVQGLNQFMKVVARFSVDPPMNDGQATDLLNRMLATIGTMDLT
jgi:hypothetical protein